MDWYYAQNSQQAGPVSQEELAELFRNGTLKPTDLVWNETMAEWTPIGKIAEFATAAPPVSEPALSPLPSSPAPDSPPSLAATPYHPQTQGGAAPRTEPLATTSLVLGLLTPLCCGVITGLPAIICGHIALSRLSKDPSLGGKGVAVAGLVLGYVGTLFNLVTTIISLSTGGFSEIIKAIESAQ